ncbi:MAG: hypothetical protein ACI4O7_13800 [Aristaeellaceae bacterium]
MKKATQYVVLWLIVFSLSGCSVSRPPMPTKEKAQELFHDNYALINTAATLLWEHYDELDCLVSDGKSMVNMYSNGRSEDDFPYSQTSLTEDEKAVIFTAWRLLGSNVLNVTYHMSLPEQAPVIALYGHYHDGTHTFHIWYGGVLSY